MTFCTRDPRVQYFSAIEHAPQKSQFFISEIVGPLIRFSCRLGTAEDRYLKANKIEVLYHSEFCHHDECVSIEQG